MEKLLETLNVDIPYAAEHFRYFAGVIQGEEEVQMFWMKNSFL